MKRVRLLISIVVILLLGVIAAGIARKFSSPSLSAQTTPAEEGSAAAISLNTSFDPSTHGELTAVELDLGRGFVFDPRAADTCSDAQARASLCPNSSSIGRGQGKIVVQGTYLPRTSYRVGATFYLAESRHHGDLAGIVLDLYETQSSLHIPLFGRVAALKRGSYGLALRFSNTNTELPSGYSLSLLQLNILLSAHRTAEHSTYNLLTNPNSCAGTGWPVQLLIDSAGQPEIYHGNASCRP